MASEALFAAFGVKTVIEPSRPRQWHYFNRFVYFRISQKVLLGVVEVSVAIFKFI